MDFKELSSKLASQSCDFQKQIQSATRMINEQTNPIAELNQKKQEAILDTAEILRQMNVKMDAERQARIEAEKQAKIQRKSDKCFAIAGVTIGLLTLIATILFGILG